MTRLFVGDITMFTFSTLQVFQVRFVGWPFSSGCQEVGKLPYRRPEKQLPAAGSHPASSTGPSLRVVLYSPRPASAGLVPTEPIGSRRVTQPGEH